MEFFLLKTFLMLVVLPCGLAAVMPNKRWLLAYVTLVTGFILWAHYDIQAPYEDDPAYDPGIGGSIGKFLFYSAVIVFYAAALARALGLTLRDEGARRLWVHVASYSVLAFMTAGYVYVEAKAAWKARGPSRACASATFSVALAGEMFQLPALRWLLAGVQDNSRLKSYRFQEQYLRRFCDHVDRATDPAPVEYLIFDFRYVPRAGSERHDDFCDAARRNGWQTLVCSKGWPLLDDGGIQIACLTGASGSHAPLRCRFEGNTHDAFTARHAELEGGLKGPESRGGLALYTDPEDPRAQFWIGTTDDGSLLAFQCEAGASVGRSTFCRTEYSYGPGLLLSYTFWSPPDRLPTIARRADWIVNALVGELREDQPG